MTRGTYGIFKGLHRGHGIYWTNRGYNCESDDIHYPTMRTAKKAIDDNIVAEQKREDAILARKITDNPGKYILAHINVDGSVTVTIPDNDSLEYPDKDAFRRHIFRLEDEFDKEVIWC